jgi:hypothetical protein
MFLRTIIVALLPPFLMLPMSNILSSIYVNIPILTPLLYRSEATINKLDCIFCFKYTYIYLQNCVHGTQWWTCQHTEINNRLIGCSSECFQNSWKSNRFLKWEQMALDIIQRKWNVIMNPDVMMSAVKVLGSCEFGLTFLVL